MPSFFGAAIKPHAHTPGSGDGGQLTSAATKLDTNLLANYIALWAFLTGGQ